jgi:similar to stage IV sporulation protein
MGTFGLGVDGDDLRNHVLLGLPELGWIAVNVTGCRAHVQVRERVEAPEIVNRRGPSNLVARRGGLVLKIRTLAGERAVLPGATVTEGQLLISGVEDLETLGARMLAGMGRVEARTWHTLTCRIPLTQQEKRYTGREKRGVSLVFGKRRVKFFSNSSIEGQKYDKILNTYRCNFLGIPLPLKLTAETFRFYETEETARPAPQAERLGETILMRQLEHAVEPYGTVRSTLCTSRLRGDVLEVTLSAECVEEIGTRVPILTETEEPGPGP